MLAALTKQVAYGPINKCKKLPEIGYFDWFGNDRQKAWTELGNMKKNHAMEELIHLVDKSIPGLDQEIDSRFNPRLNKLQHIEYSSSMILVSVQPIHDCTAEGRRRKRENTTRRRRTKTS